MTPRGELETESVLLACLYCRDTSKTERFERLYVNLRGHEYLGSYMSWAGLDGSLVLWHNVEREWNH